jgi:hypothetical protein
MTTQDIFDIIKNNQHILNTVFGLGTLVSVIVAIITLKEVIKQRQSMYKPEVLIKSFYLSISKSPLFKETAELLLFKTAPFNDYSVNYNDLPFSINKNYKIDNVGFGPAENIICEWKFDTSTAIKKIKEILPEKMHFNFLNSLDLYLLVIENNQDFHYSANARIQEQEISYISPINVSDHYHLHAIPEIIIFSYYLFLIFKKGLIQKSCPNFGVFEFEDFPQPELYIKYYDLNGKKYTKKFQFEITAISLQVEENILMDKEFAMLQFKPKNY